MIYKTRTAGGAHRTHETQDTRHTNGDGSTEKQDSQITVKSRGRIGSGNRVGLGAAGATRGRRGGVRRPVRAGQAGTGASVAVRVGRSGGWGVAGGVGYEADVAQEEGIAGC